MNAEVKIAVAIIFNLLSTFKVMQRRMTVMGTLAIKEKLVKHAINKTSKAMSFLFFIKRIDVARNKMLTIKYLCLNIGFRKKKLSIL